MNRPSRTRHVVFVVLALSVALLLSGCVSQSLVDDSTPVVVGSASSSADPSATAAADEEAVEAGSGEPAASPAPSQSQAPAPSPSQSAAQAPSPSPSPSTAGITFDVISQRCVSGRLTVTMTANYDSSYRKGIRSIVVERPNEYNAMLDADASWLGHETGQGNQWTVQPPGSRQQRFKDTLRTTVRADGGPTKVYDTAITANC